MKRSVIGMILSVLLMTGCGDSGMKGPTNPTSGLTPEALPLRSDSPTTPPVAAPSNGENGCNIIQVNQAGIKVETSCTTGVRFYVPATTMIGSGYYNIWLPAINAGKMLGPFSYNTWSPWVTLDSGKYSYQVAAETKTDSGKVYQCDRHHGEFEIPECETKCVMPEEPKCEYGPALYNPKDCTWSCPLCVMPEPPKCQFGPPVPKDCGWVCPPCVLPPAPECEFGKAIPDMEACGWDCPPCIIQCLPPHAPNLETCSCECPEQPKPKCSEQVWNEVTCSWIGDCKCEPEGEGKCPDFCEWDYDLCKWVCDCPCVPTECSFGYEWNQEKCKCVPKSLCHVSNKGKDGNWNIQESQTKFNPGHAKHLDASKFCPPDYFGMCNNRYATNPHSCMNQ